MEEVTYQATCTSHYGGLMTPVLAGLHSPRCAEAESEAVRDGDTVISHRLKSSRETLLGFIILINCVTMGLELDYPWEGWSRVNQAMLVLYIVDLCVRLWEEGWRRFALCPWSWIDTLVVVASILELWVLPFIAQLPQVDQAISVAMLLLRICRLIRAVRVFRIVVFMKPLFCLFSGLSEAFSAILWLLVLVFIVLYAFALVFTQLLGHGMLFEELDEETNLKAKETFATVPLTIYGLFRVMGADMTDLGPLLSATSGLALPLCYVSFQICASWLLLSTLTATVVNTMLQFTEKQNREEDSQKALQARLTMHESLESFFEGLEVNCYEEVQYEQLQAFLSTDGTADRLHSIANIGISKAISIWEAMQVDGAVHLDKYIDQLVLVASDNLESSIMRIEMQVRQLHDVVNQHLPALEHVPKAFLPVHRTRPDTTALTADEQKLFSPSRRHAHVAQFQRSSPDTSRCSSKTLQGVAQVDLQLQQLGQVLSGQLRTELASAVAALSCCVSSGTDNAASAPSVAIRGDASAEQPAMALASLPCDAHAAAPCVFKSTCASSSTDHTPDTLSTAKSEHQKDGVCNQQDLPRLLRCESEGIEKTKVDKTM